MATDLTTDLTADLTTNLTTVSAVAFDRGRIVECRVRRVLSLFNTSVCVCVCVCVCVREHLGSIRVEVSTAANPSSPLQTRDLVVHTHTHTYTHTHDHHQHHNHNHNHNHHTRQAG